MKGRTPTKPPRNAKRAERSKSNEKRVTSDCSWDDESPIPPSSVISNAEPGFLGSTAYNAVLEESEENAMTENLSVSSPLPSPFISQRIQGAFLVLNMLNDFESFERMVGRWVSNRRQMSFLASFAIECADSIRKTLFRGGIHQKSDKEKLEVVQTIFQNTTARPVVRRSTRFADYIKFFTGSSMRWECLGIFFTACGLCCHHMTVDDPEFAFLGNREEDRQALMSRLLDASNSCVTFCEDSGPLSDMALWIALENCIYASQVLGDAHYIVWRKLGDLSTAIYASGIHQEGRGLSNPEVPFWLAAMRNRALGNSYSIDKLLCTFVGRPPRISKRYCHISPPLDLEFAEIALEGADLERALANIGEEGWNRAVKGRKSVYQRCFVLNALLREEVLELSLGPDQDDMLQKSENLIHRSRELLNSLPEYIRYSEQMWIDTDPVSAFFASQEYLDILYNEFMIRRMRVARLGDDHSELLQISHKILETVLEGSQMRGLRGSHGGCIPWIIVLYGLPTAAVLALELLQQKQSQLRNDYPPRTQAFPSSKIIQELSVFISTLRYVHSPGDGNYALAEQARNSLQRILDKTLSIDNMPLPGRIQLPGRMQLLSPTSTSAIVEEAESGYHDLSWIDNAQFDADFWTNLPDHPFLSETAA